jgi:hypothetical protein
MTKNNREKQIEEILERNTGEYQGRITIRFDDAVKELTTLLTQTDKDMGEIRKEFFEFWNTPENVIEDGGIDVSPRKIWNFFAPHLSNKSELKKEAVREFVDFYESINDLNVTKGCSHVRKIAEEYLSSNEKEVSGGKDE